MPERLFPKLEEEWAHADKSRPIVRAAPKVPTDVSYTAHAHLSSGLHPDQRLSKETLAEELGVSRTPLRHFLGRLGSEGLLRSVQSVGTIVTDIDIEELGET